MRLLLSHHLKPRVLQTFEHCDALSSFLVKHLRYQVLGLFRYYSPILWVKLKLLLEHSFEDLLIVVTLKRRIPA